MAISKLMPIKSTLDKAIDYILNPEKTDNGLLVSSFGCSPETADIEMKITGEKGLKNGNRIAYHLIQSFSPEDDLTGQKALEIGKEFANKVTGGRYEYVIATHMDGAHLHNHIIFNSTSFIDHKKYHCGMKEKHTIRQINDMLCRENHLSVIEKVSGKRGYGKYEYNQRKAKDSWKQILEKMIDSAIAKSVTFEEFLEQMKLEGYEVKLGKHISFRAPGQERFCRGKRIGEAYTEESIRNRIENKEKQRESGSREQEQYKEPKANKTKTGSAKPFQNRKVNLIVDISKNIKAQQSRGYEQALVKGNINALVKTMNYLIQHGLKNQEDFNSHYLAVATDAEFLLRSRKKLSGQMLDLREKIKFTQNYKKNKSIYFESMSALNKNEFYRLHEHEIIQYKAAQIYFEKEGIDPEKLNLYNLFQEYKSLKEEKIQIDKQYEEVKEKKYELEVVKQNLEYALELEFEKEEKEEQQEKQKETDAQRNDIR